MEPAGVRSIDGLLPWAAALAGADRLRVVSRRPEDDRRLGRRATAVFAGAGLIGVLYPWAMRFMFHVRTGAVTPGPWPLPRWRSTPGSGVSVCLPCTLA